MTEMTADFAYNQKSRDIGMQRERVKTDFELTKEAVGAIAGKTSAIDAVINMGTTAYNYANTVLDYTRASEYNKAMYGHNRTKELTEFGYSQAVVQPEISTPYNANLIREMTNNGVIVYRYKYSENDLARIDKLLTMFGYAIVRPVTMEDIYENGKTSGFTYLECQGISLTSDTLPKWYLDLMEAEIESGIRIWHSRPTGA